MKIALLGPKGTFTHQAAHEYFDEIEPIFFSTIKEVFNSDIEVKVVPIENSIGGGVHETIDLLNENDKVKITGEQRLKIKHSLLSNEESIDEIDTIKSHPQALSQCNDFLSDKDWNIIETHSTAEAAANLKEGEAAIASSIAGEVYNVNILEEGIQDVESNITRFFILNNEESKGEKTSLIINPDGDRPGLLSNMLSCFSGHGINLSHIQSRPKKTELGEYYFYIEAESDQNNEEFKRSIKCLKSYSEVRILGSYTSKGGGLK